MSTQSTASTPREGPAGTRPGRPPLTERRKAQTRLDLAQHALDLFLRQGVADTTAEQIADAAGISLRTLWRYVPTKESCVRPLLDVGLEDAARRLRSLAVGRPLAEAWANDAEPGDPPYDAGSVMDLVRLTRTEPGLRAVWLQAHHDAIPVFAEALAERAGTSPGTLDSHVRAALVNAALAVAIEQFAFAPPRRRATLDETIRRALALAEEGLGR